jgi:hypothetical protein
MCLAGIGSADAPGSEPAPTHPGSADRRRAPLATAPTKRVDELKRVLQLRVRTTSLSEERVERREAVLSLRDLCHGSGRGEHHKMSAAKAMTTETMVHAEASTDDGSAKPTPPRTAAKIGRRE